MLFQKVIYLIMLRIKLSQLYKSIPAGKDFELPDFTVITGENGSGKTHFLEALSDQNRSDVRRGSVSIPDRRYFSFGALVAKTDETSDPSAFSSNKRPHWVLVQQIIQDYRRQQRQDSGLTERDFLDRRAELKGNAFQKSVVEALNEFVSNGDSLDNVSPSDFSHLDSASDLLIGSEPFAADLASIFADYNRLLADNLFADFLFQRGKATRGGLTDEVFVARHGPKPWDLVNDTLRRIGLGYVFESPDLRNSNEPFRLNLIDEKRRNKVSPARLSTGERVLLALVLAIYRTEANGQVAKLLLLDEPDASLHPNFSRILVEVLFHSLVQKAGVSVIMTTHSPATLSICPEHAVFEMDRARGRPKKITREKGIELLSSGISHLRVSTEPRRQVFVESRYDVTYFASIFRFLDERRRFGFEPIFLPPNSGTSNCTDVKEIVSALESAGSDLVRGIIDWDLENEEKGKVFILGEGNRYSIENYILDPLFIALALIRNHKRDFSDFDIDLSNGYLSVNELTKDDAEKLALGILIQSEIEWKDCHNSVLENGWIIERPREFLEMQGHNWEHRVLDAIPDLNVLVRGKTTDDKLKRPLLDIIQEVPQFLPQELRTTLERLE